MNAEKLQKDIAKAIEMVESIHDDMVDEFIAKDFPSEIVASAMEFTSRLATVVWYLRYVNEGVSA